MRSSTSRARRSGPSALVLGAALTGAVVLVGGLALGLKVLVRRRHRDRPVGDAVLQERITEALAVDGRSWWLPQPEVAVQSGTVTLSGGSPHPSAHDAVLAVVRSVAPSSAIRDGLVDH